MSVREGEARAASGAGGHKTHQRRSETRDGMRIDWDVPITMDDGLVLRADGSEIFEIAMTGAVGDAERLGAEAGRDLLDRLPAGLLG